MALTDEQKRGFVRRSVEAYLGAYEVCAAAGSHCPSTEVLVAGLIEYCYVPDDTAVESAVRDALLEILGDASYASTGGNASNAKGNAPNAKGNAPNAKGNASANAKGNAQNAKGNAQNAKGNAPNAKGNAKANANANANANAEGDASANANANAPNAKANASNANANAKGNAEGCVAGLKRTRARLIEALDLKVAVVQKEEVHADEDAIASHLLSSSSTDDNTEIAKVLAKLKESGMTADDIEKLYKEVIDPVPLAAFVGATIDCSTHGGYCPMLGRIVGGIVAHCCRKTKVTAEETANIKKLLLAVMRAQPTVGGGVLKGVARVACGVLAACTAVVSIGLVLIAASAGGSANGIENLFMLPMALGDYAFKGVWFDDDMPDYMTPLELQKE